MGNKKEYDLVRSASFLGEIPEDYTLLNDAYFGTGGFKSGEYLVPHPRESLDKYNRRRFMSYYCNYVKPCVSAHVDPIFKDYPVREYDDNEFFNKFINDVDGKGTKIDRFMKRAATRAKLFGMVLIVIDNASDMPKNLEGAIQKRAFPYLYIVKPQQIKDYVLDKFDNLSMISYELQETIIENNTKVTKNITWKWTKDKWFKIDGGTKIEGENKIKTIPVIPLFGSLNEEGSIHPTSDFYGIARTNLAIFNACSELRELVRNQAFNILIYPVAEDGNYDEALEIIAGTNDVLLYRGNSGGKPELIAPSAVPGEMIMNELAMMIQEIYRMAALSNVTGVQEQTSGVAKEWDNQSTHQTIAEFAKNLEEVEEKIGLIFGLYVNKTLNFIVNYNDEYGVVDVSAKLDEVTKALALAIGGKFNIEVKKQAARIVLKDVDDDVINTVIDEIDKSTDDNIYSKSELMANG